MPAEAGAARPVCIRTRYGEGLYLGDLPPERAAASVDRLIGSALEGRGTVLHRARNLVVACPEAQLLPDGIALKIFAPPRGARRLPGLAGKGKARRHFEAAARLLDRGVPTPRPVAAIQEQRGRTLGRGYLLTGLVSETVAVREILKGRDSRFPGGPDEAFVRALGRFVHGLHAAGVVHRDLSDGNILVSTLEGTLGFQVIDLNRARVRGRVGMLAATRDAIRVGVPTALQRPFLAACFDLPAPHPGTWLAYRWLKHAFELKLSFRRFAARFRRRAAA